MQRNYSSDLLSPEKSQILEEADLETLCEFFRMCQKQKMPRNALVNEIEKQIYKKWIMESNYHADYIYKLDKNIFYQDVCKKNK
jgi:hypothetical protein